MVLNSSKIFKLVFNIKQIIMCTCQGGQKTWNNLELDKLGKIKKTWNFIDKSWKNLELFLNLNF